MPLRAARGDRPGPPGRAVHGPAKCGFAHRCPAYGRYQEQRARPAPVTSHPHASCRPMRMPSPSASFQEGLGVTGRIPRRLVRGFAGLRGHVARLTANWGAARHAPGESPWFRAAADPFLGLQARGPRSGLEIGARRDSAQGLGRGAARAAGGTVPPTRHRFLWGSRPDGGQAWSSLRSLPPLIWILRGLAVSATGMVRVSTPAS